jgi:uncharacterized 2Fe-2S/4Fe-4S cluster protein (DUF4445 family)
MGHKVVVRYLDKEFISDVEHGSNLLEHIRNLDVQLNTPCGGNGTCGKCRILTESSGPMSDKEARLLGHTAVSKGYRLACYLSVNEDMDVFIESINSNSMNKASVHDVTAISDPDPEMKHIEIKKPSLSDQKANLNRVLESAEMYMDGLDLDLMYKIDNLINNGKYRMTAISYGQQLLDVTDGWLERIYSIAVDIGTTTVAVYLVDNAEGKIVDADSFLNPQKKFGADVISRIDYIKKNKGIKVLNDILISELNRSIARLAAKNNISQDMIYSSFFVGNTVMLHILLLLDPANIAAAPFIPQTTKSHKANAIDYGLEINGKGIIINIPMVSGYIGADTIGAILSSGMYKNSELSLLLDLGTNGEIVIGNSKFLISCSAAAGPAFEGANIRNGMAGVQGAIDKIWMDNGKLMFTVIGGTRPEGICGSAIIDIIALLLQEGVIDETGRFDETELLKDDLKARRTRIDSMEAFVIYSDEESGELIAVTQKDIREVQNAKAAIAAGIKVLMGTRGIKTGDIKKVYLAGGFGSYVDIKSAALIGLIPKQLENAVVSVGNAAGAGAVLCAIACDLLKMSIELSESVEYIELSSDPDFTGYYMEEMIFE